MSMIEIHKDALQSSNIPYNDFLLFYRIGGKKVYGFVEGKTDPSFYRTFIENVLTDGWECRLIPAGNKENVLNLFAAMDWGRFPKKAICFFVDRDLSEFLGGEKYQGDNLFVSDCYSIENEILNEHTLERTLEEICCIGILKPDELQKLKELFLSNLIYFKEALACVMAQIIIWRRAQQKGDNLIARLECIKVKTFFEFSFGRIALKSNYVSSAKRIEHAANSVKAQIGTQAELKTAEEEFRAKAGIDKFVRGKYLVSFFLECTEALRVAIPTLFNRHLQPPGKSAAVGEATAIMIIGPRARCPNSLRTFLDCNYGEHIKNVPIAV